MALKVREAVSKEDETYMSELRRNSTSSENEQSVVNSEYINIPYGFQSKACYKPKSKSKEITGVTYNSRSRQFIILDPKGVTAWSYNNVVNSVSHLLEYPSYQFNLIRLLLHSRKHNVYFGLSKDHALKVFNLNFHEVFSVVSDMNSVLCMVFNSKTDELITGGTGGVKFWSFGEIKKTEQSFVRDSRPMANYGLILRFEHPGMRGSWVKDIVLDENNQRLYCLSEGNVVAYDLEGNFLFMLKSAHQGLVTGCIYSKYSNFVVTAGTDCMVNVWSSNGGYVHSFNSHSKMITNLFLHPQAPSLVLTSSYDGTVKIFSLDIMEEIYSHVVLPEGVVLMSFITNDLFYCSNSKALQVFSINHVANFCTTVRCPLKQLKLSISPDKKQKIMAIADDNSTRILSRSSELLSIVLPPPTVTTSDQNKPCVCAHTYSPLHSLMYLLVNKHEIWVYYTKTNPANRVEVWQLSDVRDIKEKERFKGRTSPFSDVFRHEVISERMPSRRTMSPTLYSSNKIVDNVACLSLAFLNSSVILNNIDEFSDITCYLVAGLQDGRLLFLSPFAAYLMYHQFQVTKGAVVSIEYDTRYNSLVLQTVTLNECTIQIRSLPNLTLQHCVNVASDITCFFRMDEKLLSGHRNGRLKLHHFISHSSTLEQVLPPRESEKSKLLSGKKSSKDHFDIVLSVDGNKQVELFCSSSKDRCIKVWDKTKTLLREIMMDETLTVVCFLNSNGDLLTGFKNNLFIISHKKAQLSFLNKNTDIQNYREENSQSETESDVYEDPRIRFEFKKTFPAEPVRMETYLVPFANMSINLARYLSGNILPSSFDDHVSRNEDESESELSDVFSVAPTELYMSQEDTPLSRSRSSSIISSWDFPRLGCSPVSSPPRTPPPVMTAVTAELESDEEAEQRTDTSFVPTESFTYEISHEPNKKYPAKVKQVGPVIKPVITRRERTGISRIKIDSEALRTRTKNWKRNQDTTERDNEANQRGGLVTNIKVDSFPGQIVQTNRVKRSVVKKTKQSVVRSRRRIKNGELSSLEIKKDQNGNKISKSSSTITKEEKEDKITFANSEQEETSDDTTSRENTYGSKTLFASGEGNEKTEFKQSRSVEQDEAEEVKDIFNSKDQLNGESVINPSSKIDNTIFTEIKYQRTEHNSADDENSDETEGAVCCDKETMMNDQEIFCQKPMKENLMLKTATESRSSSVYSFHEQLPEPPDNYDTIGKENISSNELNTNEKSISSSSDSERSMREEKQENPVSNQENISKMVTFLDPETSKDEKIVSKTSQTRLRPNSSQRYFPKSTIRSSSPVNHPPKVVPIIDSRFLGHGKGLVPISALKVYTLAKTHRKLPSSNPAVPRPRAKHETGKSHVSHDIDSPLQTIDVSEAKKVLVERNDVMRIQRVKEVRERKVHDEKKDLVGWCIRALSEKTKYPIFSPKPRLRTRRSLYLENKQAVDEEVFARTESEQTRHSVVTREKQSIRIPGPNEMVEVERVSEDLRLCSGIDNKLGSKTSFGIGRKLNDTRSNNEHFKEIFQSCSNIGLYGEGWQERCIERARELKEKRLERERKVIERQRHDMRTLEEKRRVVLEDRAGTGHVKSCLDLGVQVIEQVSTPVRKKETSYEKFKNNPVLYHPYRLRKFETPKDEDWMATFDIDHDRLPESIIDFIPRPKSAPSIPSKCRKFVLVTSVESDDRRNSPEATPLEETLLLKRFPKSKLKKNSRQPSSALYRPHSVAKLQTVEMFSK